MEDSENLKKTRLLSRRKRGVLYPVERDKEGERKK
jgi:hypothetical protein